MAILGGGAVSDERGTPVGSLLEAAPARLISRLSLPQNFEGDATKIAPHTAPKRIASDKSTFDERAVPLAM